MKQHALKIVIGVALVALAATAGAASAEDVDVSVLVTPGGRDVQVLEVATDTQLTELDFGNRSRSLPFRVRAIDSNYDRKMFNVDATMTNLYLDDGGIQFGTIIPSAKLSLGDTLTLGVNVTDVIAHIVAGLDTTVRVPNTDVALGVSLCSIVTGGVVDGGDCVIDLGSLTSNPLDLPVTIGDLAALPLVPQGPQTDSFDLPAFEGVAAGDADAIAALPGGYEPTRLRLLAGGLADPTGGALDDLLAALTGTLNGVLATADPTDVVEESVLRTAISGVLDTVLPITPIVNGILADGTFVFDLTDALSLDDVLQLTGTYVSIPTLKVDPTEAAVQGTYVGRMTVTIFEAP
jgi:hypothetical protein